MIFLIIVAVCLFWIFDDEIAEWLWGDKKKEQPVESTPEYECEICNDTGLEEVMGDGDNFEWDVIGHKLCRCKRDKDYEWDN